MGTASYTRDEKDIFFFKFAYIHHASIYFIRWYGASFHGIYV